MSVFTLQTVKACREKRASAEARANHRNLARYSKMFLFDQFGKAFAVIGALKLVSNLN